MNVKGGLVVSRHYHKRDSTGQGEVDGSERSDTRGIYSNQETPRYQKNREIKDLGELWEKRKGEGLGEFIRDGECDFF